MQNKMMAPSGAAISVLAACLFVIGCGGSADRAGGAGSIQVDGSSTVYPITEAVAEEYRVQAGSETRVTVGVSGTGGGFERFCRGEIEISNASRTIGQSESEACQRNGVEFVELRVAFDGLSVVTNPANEFVRCLTVEELREIWRPQSQVRRWSDIRPEWPNQEIALYGPGTSSGTFDYFTEAIMGEEDASRADYTASEDDNVLVQGVSGDANALGYFGYAYYEENQEQIKLLGVDNDEGCVRPTPQTIQNGTYAPLSRPLFIYVNREALQRSEVVDFTRFYLQNAPELARQVGYIVMPDSAYQNAMRKLQQAQPTAQPTTGGGA